MIQRVLRSRRLKAMVIGFLDLFFIKNPNKILFVVKDRTFFSGNLRVVLERYLKESSKLYIYKDGVCPEEIRDELNSLGVVVLERVSFISAFHILTSGVFILSHNPRDAHIYRKFRGRKIINLWHGVAIKRIENLMPNITPLKQKQLKNNAKLYDMVIASSKEDKKTNARAFGVNSSRVKITGLPRYAILQKDYPLKEILKRESKKIEEIKRGRKLILFAPTFREANISAITKITNDEWVKLEKFIAKNYLLFGIRPHPYDIKDLPNFIRDSPHFTLLLSSEFTEANIVLKYSDVLIVDFTSIWIDYLLLKRPIIGFAKDYKHYLEEERGFVYDFNTIFPTNFVDNIDNLIYEIKKSIDIDKPIEYEPTTKTLHDYSLEHDFIENIYNQIELVRGLE
jgi:CDP-glycerol glycerophosphotransferase (TagB/SpsB family)